MSAQLGMLALSEGLGLVKHWMNAHYQSKVDIARIEAQREVMLAAIDKTAVPTELVSFWQRLVSVQRTLRCTK